MSTSLYFILLVFGVFIGAFSGLLGIGGGILMIPGMMLLFGFSQQEAQGTSLAVMIPPIGLFAAIVYYQHGYIRLPVVGVVAGGFLIGAYFGAKLVPHVPQHVLRLAFGTLLLYLGFMFVIQSSSKRTSAALPAGVATIVALFVGRFARRFRSRSQGTQDGETGPIDYHI